MNKKYILTTIAVCLLAGCASKPHQVDESARKYEYTWSKDGTTSADFNRDMYECETAAQQRLLMSQQAMNQYKYARNNMGIVGLSLDEPEELNDEDVPVLLKKCIESRGWKSTKKVIQVRLGQDIDDVIDQHAYQAK